MARCMAEAAHGQHLSYMGYIGSLLRTGVALPDGRPVFAGARAGIIPTSVFANGTAGASYVSADGEW